MKSLGKEDGLIFFNLIQVDMLTFNWTSNFRCTLYTADEYYGIGYFSIYVS